MNIIMRIFFAIIFTIVLIPVSVAVSKNHKQKNTDLYSWKTTENRQTLFSGEEQIGYIQPFSLVGIDVEDHITLIDEGVFNITRKCTNRSNVQIDSVRVTLDFMHLDSALFLMIPSVSYNGNLWGQGKEPKGFSKNVEWWTFSYNRTSVPGATYSEGKQWAIALWGKPSLEMPFSCSLMPEKSETGHRLIWPEEEMPLSYINRDTYISGFRKKMSLKAGQEIILEATLVVAPVLPQHKAMKVFLTKAWELIPHPEIPVRKPREIWDLSMRFIHENLWAEEGVFKGFSVGLWSREGKWIQRPVWKYEIGWAGQNLSTANSFLTDYLWNKNELSLKRGLACLDTWAEYCPLPNGLIRNHFDYVLGIEKSEEILDACNLGDAAADYLFSYQLLKECGLDRENYKTIALNICDFLKNDQQTSGQYGKSWNTEGICLHRDGTIGAFIIPAMVRAYQISRDDSYLNSAKKAYDFYFSDFTENGFTSAGALDTWCIDRESSLPMLRSAMMLFETTKDSTYLTKAEQTSWYLSTWMWHYSMPAPDSSDFRKYGYDTFGGMAVSTQHHHLDPCGVVFVPEWLKLAKLTGHSIWNEKAMATWANGNQTVAGDNCIIHNIHRPVGAQNEAFFQARWGGNPTQINDWLVLWPSAFRVETLRTIGLEGLGK